MGYVDSKEKVRTIVIDCDGCLTDGKQYITSDGSKLFKAFHSRDVAAIRELIYNGWRVVIVTADDDLSGKHFAEKVGAEFLFLRDKSKIPFDYLAAVGDSAWDIPTLNKATYAFCPYDADRNHTPLHTRRLQRNGGEGLMTDVIAELKAMGEV